MITNQDLATLSVRQIIFHDVPNNPKGGNTRPTLTDTETKPDQKRLSILERRLKQVFGGGAAYPVRFVGPNDTRSPVEDSVRGLTAKSPPPDLFVAASRKMAQYLFDQQGGATSPGLLCVLTVSCGSKAGMAIMKLEREEGADIFFREERGHSSFEMSVLDNLVLTDGTRLFKSAFFLKSGADILALVCDTQSNPISRSDVADFWLRFLGCRFVVDPRISTQKWFETSVRFVNEHVDNPVKKQELYEHIVSEMNSNRQTVSPKQFIADYVMKDLRQEYSDFLDSNEIPLQQFKKDTADIKSKLQRMSYHTDQGVTVTVSVEREDLVKVGPKQIVVHDKLRKISRK